MFDEESGRVLVQETVRAAGQRAKHWQLPFLSCLICVAFAVQSAPAQLRVVTYNTAGGPNPGLEDVLAAIGPIDVLALQEQRALATTTAAIAEMLNGIYGARVYMPGTLEGGTTSESTGRPGLIYNTTTVQLIGEETVGADSTTGQPRQTLRYQLRPAGYGPSADFFIYNSHYKAGTGLANRDRRNVEAVAIRADLDGLGDGVHAILAGDFNVYRSDEPMYLTLTADGYGKAVDPLRRPGRWSDSERFKAIHTQAPAVSPNGDGGMDDRFDFQLVTEEFLDDEGLDYIEGSYRAFGNDGSHALNGNISSGTAESPEVLAALMTASDHLPVVADYQLPAILDVIAGEVPPVLNLGQPFSLEITIRNDAQVDVSLGADELNYMLTISGSLVGSDSEGEVLALSEGNTHSFELDTSSAGLKSGTILVTSDGQGIAGGVAEIPVAYEVVVGLHGDYSGNGMIDQSDLDLVLASWGKPFDEIPSTWVGTTPTEGIIDQAELDAVLTSWGQTGGALAAGGQPAKGVPEPASLALLLCMLAAPCLCRRARAHPTPNMSKVCLCARNGRPSPETLTGLCRGKGVKGSGAKKACEQPKTGIRLSCQCPPSAAPRKGVRLRAGEKPVSSKCREDVLMFGPVEQSKKFPLFFKMPTGPGHYFGRPAIGRDYGQKFLIAFLMELSEQWFGQHPQRPFGIGDLAEEDASPMGDHVSHTTGAAVDLFIIHKNGVQRNDKANLITFKDKDVYDAARTTDLAKMIATKALQYKLIQFLYNDPDVQKDVPSSPPIQTFSNHDEHIHILFNGQHPHTEEELDRILGIKSLTERLQELLQQLVSSLQMLMFGSRGTEVQALQVLLNSFPSAQSPPLAEDGIFGPKTRASVQGFQQQRALVADGIVGPKTKKALQAALGS